MLQALRNKLFRETFWLELANGVLLAVWAIVLFLPPPTFPSSPSYGTLGSWGDETSWAALATLFSLSALIGLRNGFRSTRNIGLLGGVFFWGTVGTAIVLANVASTGGWVYFSFGTICALAFVFGRR